MMKTTGKAENGSIAKKSKIYPKEVDKEAVLKHIEDTSELALMLKALTVQEHLTMTEKVELVVLIFTTGKTPKFELIPYLWNFMRELYNSMNKLLLKLVPTIAMNKNQDLSDKHMIMYKEITVRLFYVMAYMKDDDNRNLEIICNNILIISKFMLKNEKFSDFFSLLNETFFNVSHNYQFKLLAQDSVQSESFLEHLLTRFFEFRELDDEKMKELNLNCDEIYMKFNTILLFYLNFESGQKEVDFKKCEKFLTVLFNLKLVTSNEMLVNCGKLMIYLIKFLTAKDLETVPAISKRMIYYMEKICEKSVLNSNESALDTVSMISIIFEKNKFVIKKLQSFSKETIADLIQMIKLTVSLSSEPSRKVCDLKTCEKNNKKHAITNLTRMAMKLFEIYVSKTKENDIDEDILLQITQLTIFHFDVLGRLSCSTKTSNEHNDIRRMYSTFANRSKSNPSKYLLKIFEIILKYSFNHNLKDLVSPVMILLQKYYKELGDSYNITRIEWLSILSNDQTKEESFNNLCYNWAVKRQLLTKEELIKSIEELLLLEFEYKTELIPKDRRPEDVFYTIVETINTYNHKSFRPIQDCLIEVIMRKPNKCPLEVISLFFYATDSLLVDYKSEIEYYKRELLADQKNEKFHIGQAILNSFSYSIYVEELRKELKKVEMSSFYSKDLDLKSLSIRKEKEQLEILMESFKHIKLITNKNIKLTTNETRIIMGILKRNIHHFQLAGLELEEIWSCKLLYEFAKESQNVESQLLSLGNLINHIHFLTKEPDCKTDFPDLIKTIASEGYSLIFSQLKNLQFLQSHHQILVVFCVCNMIKLNADLGNKDVVYDQLMFLKEKIDSVKTSTETTVLDMQYNLISYQLFLKYSSESNVNHLVVIREIFLEVRLLHKISDLYSLFIYDILVEMISFGMPRYETKAMEFYICTALKYFLGLGSATRILDVLLLYSNWGLYCENIDKYQPLIEYAVEILDLDTKACKGNELLNDVDEKNQLFIQKVFSISDNKTANLRSPRIDIIAFKLNCFLARKFYIDQCYDKSMVLYDKAYNSYQTISDRIYNFSVKLEFQQFFINVLFQYSNVFAKMGNTEKWTEFSKKTTDLIKKVGVNRIALAQEAHFQEMTLKRQHMINGAKTKTPDIKRNPNSTSPIEIEMSSIKNMKLGSDKSSKSRRPKKLALDDDSDKSSGGSKTPKLPKSTRKKPTSKTLTIKIDSPVVAKAKENSSDLSNKEIKEVKEEPKKRVTRKIPVRTSAVKIEKIEIDKEIKTRTKLPTSTARSKNTKSDIPELAVNSRKISRRMI